jgi:hypothetical protein
MHFQNSGAGAASMVKWVGIGLLLLTAARPLAAQSKPADEKGTSEATLALKNPSFEQGDKSPDGWITNAQFPGAEYLWDKTKGYKSKSSVGVKRTDDKLFPIAMWSQTVPNTGKTSKLKVSVWVKTDQAYKAAFDVGFVPAEGDGTHVMVAYIGPKEKTDPPATHDWKEHSGVVAIPKGTQDIRIGLQVYGPGTVWFDNVSAQYVPDDTPVNVYDDKATTKPDKKP